MVILITGCSSSPGVVSCPPSHCQLLDSKFYRYHDPVVAHLYSDQEAYDLIVLSGGTADPMGSDPWVLKLQDFLRTTVDYYPQQKIVGVSWGHQTICVAFRGAVGRMDVAEIGVTRMKLTEEGCKMFLLNAVLHHHQFHRREIKVPAQGFVRLAEQHKAFLNDTNTIPRSKDTPI
jgi:GMP synthase-like glutamine amidotransferase